MKKHLMRLAAIGLAIATLFFTSSNSFAYRVQSGDTLSKIAAENNISVDELKELNGITDASLIYAGEDIKVSHDDETIVTRQIPNSPTTLLHDSDYEILRSMFDAEWYAKQNPDVVAALGDRPVDLFGHFTSHGLWEGRQLNPDFNPSAYASAYGDLTAYAERAKLSPADTLLFMYKHYNQYGKNENREITTIEKAVENGITVTSFATANDADGKPMNGTVISAAPVSEPVSEEVKETEKPEEAVAPHTCTYTEKIKEHPTCQKEGVLEKTCSICGEVVTEHIEKVDCAFNTVRIDPTCQKEGKTYDECIWCGKIVNEKVLPTVRHHARVGTGRVIDTCDCGNKDCTREIYAKITTEPTCTATGVGEFDCKYCHEHITVELPATGHDPEKTSLYGPVVRYSQVVTEPTCVDEGLEKHYSLCRICKEEIDVEYTVIPATGSHSLFGNAEKVQCHNCDYECNHTNTHKDVTTEATCTQKEIYDIYCDECEFLLVSDVEGDFADHTPGEAHQEDVVAASCTAAGSYNEVVRCTECNEIISSEPKTIDQLAHTYGTDGICTICHVAECPHTSTSSDTNIITPATCSSAGSNETVVTCDTCHKVISTTPGTIPQLDHHTYGADGKCTGCDAVCEHSYSYVTTTVATETTDGLIEHKCSKCGYVDESHAYQLYSVDTGNGTTTTVSGYYNRALQQEIYEKLNAYRVDIVNNGGSTLTEAEKAELIAKVGGDPSITNMEVPALGYCEELQREADIRALESSVVFDHTRPNGEFCTTVDDGTPNPPGDFHGENLASGYEDADAMIAAWDASPGHKENMQANFGSVAISAFVKTTIDETTGFASERTFACQAFSYWETE